LVLVGKHKEKLGGKNAGPHFRCGHWWIKERGWMNIQYQDGQVILLAFNSQLTKIINARKQGIAGPQVRVWNFGFFETGSCSVAKTGTELLILCLSLPSAGLQVWVTMPGFCGDFWDSVSLCSSG
jgi:hypothetical protein